jgi:EAL domain-containing protein (putative c-di-GMP-specific phosphodiesterase class I)
MRPSGEIAGVLGTIRGWGMKLALDDFGTGFSSLAYLKRLPLTRLKIDASFVAGLPDDPEDVAVTSAILSLARDLGLEVVAEGVETETQQRYLVDRHCGILQGYLFARPLSVEALEAAFDRGQFMPALVL